MRRSRRFDLIAARQSLPRNARRLLRPLLPRVTRGAAGASV